MVEMADTEDSKSFEYISYGFESHSLHSSYKNPKYKDLNSLKGIPTCECSPVKQGSKRSHIYIYECSHPRRWKI